MFSADDIVRMYIERWNDNFHKHNSDPTKFVLDSILDSDEKIFGSAHRHEINNALDHLTLNSMQAISRLDYLKGKKILQEFKPKKPGIITYSTGTTTDNSVFDISDDGPGIDERILDKIFDYGMTTKGTQGSGLNDSMKGIKYIGGKIYVLNTNHEGTTFRIEIPR